MQELLRRALRSFSYLLLSLYRWSYRHPRALLGILLSAIFVSGLGLPRLQTVLDIDQITDDGLTASQDYRRLERDFPRGSSLYVVFAPRGSEALTPNDLRRIHEWFTNFYVEFPERPAMWTPYHLRRASYDAALDQLSFPRVWTPDPVTWNLDAFRGGPWEGILTNGRDLVFEIIFPREGPRRLSPEVYRRLEESVARMQAQSGLRVSLGGEGAFQEYSRRGLERNNLLNGVLFLGLLILMYWALGTWRGGLIFLVILGAGCALTLGLMGWFGAPIDVVSSGLVLMMAVAALQDYLFVAQHLGSAEPGRWRRAFRGLVVSSFFTSFTTIFGFFSLVVSELATIRRFGLWAGVGALVEWGLLFLVLPAMLTRWPGLRRWTSPRGLIGSPTLDRWARVKLPTWLMRGALLFYVTALVGAAHLNVTGAPKYMFVKDHPFVQDIAYFTESRGWEDRAHVVTTQSTTGEDLSRLEEKLRSVPNVARVISGEGILGDLMAALPEKAKPLARSEATSTESWRDWQSVEGFRRLEIYLRNTDLQPMTTMIAQVREICAQENCYVAGSPISQADFAVRIPRDFLESMALSLFVVAACLILLVIARSAPGHVSPRLVWAVLAGSLWAPAVVLSCYWIFQVKINFLTCLFGSVLVGMTGDNCIQYIFCGRYVAFDRGVAERGGASITVSSVVAAACLVFLGSYFESPRVFGLFLGLGLMLALAGDIWLVRFLSGAMRGSVEDVQAKTPR